jgi:amino acid transporter
MAHEEAELPSVQIDRHPQYPLEGAGGLLTETERVRKAHATRLGRGGRWRASTWADPAGADVASQRWHGANHTSGKLAMNRSHVSRRTPRPLLGEEMVPHFPDRTRIGCVDRSKVTLVPNAAPNGTPSPDHSHRPKRALGLASTVSIGIGGMVGGGIFAVLGLSIELSRGAAPIAFLIAGGVAILTATSYARLSVAYPSRGGTVTFLNETFGSGIFVGGLNVLLWLSYVVMISLYAAAFAGYADSLLPGHPSAVVGHLFLSGIIIVVAVLNIARASIVGRAEEWIVAAKVAILVLVVAFAFHGTHLSRISPGAWPDPLAIIGGGMVIFVAYEGFELISNAAEDVRNPRRTLPLALYLSVGFTIALYVLVAIVTVGTLTISQVRGASSYVLAEAARPGLGQAGFVLVAVAALLSTTSAINATLYGTARLSWTIARSGQLPEAFDKKVWDRPIEGLLVTTGLTLVVANAFNLNSIALTGSAAFLVIFAAVNAAAARLAKRRPQRLLAITAAAACVASLIALILEERSRNPSGVVIVGGLVAGSFAMEALYRKFTHRVIPSHLALPPNTADKD